MARPDRCPNLGSSRAGALSATIGFVKDNVRDAAQCASQVAQHSALSEENGSVSCEGVQMFCFVQCVRRHSYIERQL